VKWLRKIKSRTKFFAGKFYIQWSCLEDTETLAQGLTSLWHQTFDPKTQQAMCLSIRDPHQRHQFFSIKIKSNAPPAEIPQLDQLFVQSVSEDLRKKLLSHLHPQPTTTNNANRQQFLEMMQTAVFCGE
jgi:hypothetical protein